MGLKKDDLDAQFEETAPKSRGKEITLGLPPGREAVNLSAIRDKARQAAREGAAAPQPESPPPVVTAPPVAATSAPAAVNPPAYQAPQPAVPRAPRTPRKRSQPVVVTGKGAFAHNTRDGSKQSVPINTRFHPRILDYLNYYVGYMDLEREQEVALGDVHQAALADYLEARFREYGLNPDEVPEGGRYRPRR
jgi:hypothetical protein